MPFFAHQPAPDRSSHAARPAGRSRRLALAVALSLTTPAVATITGARAQAQATEAPARAETTGVWADVPFAVGERMDFDLQAKWFLIRGGGTASLAVEAVDTVHGHEAYRLGFRTKGGITVFKINDVQRSWLDVRALFSRRFEQVLDQTGYSRDRTYDFLPGEMRFVSQQNPADSGTLASDRPLDDVSFLYHIRTLPLEVGEEYSFERYFKAEGNPVTVRVLRRERIRVPAGEFDAIVVKPIIRTKGLFSEGGEAEVWFSDDVRRIPLKVRAKVSIATLTMELRSYEPGAR